MYLYKIGYGSYEESCFVSFTHEKKFTHDELTKVIGEAVVKAIKKQKAREYHDIHNFQDVFDNYKGDRDEDLDAITDAVLAAGFTREDDDHIMRTERRAKRFKNWMLTVYCSDCEEGRTCIHFKDGDVDNSPCATEAAMAAPRLDEM